MRIFPGLQFDHFESLEDDLRNWNLIFPEVKKLRLMSGINANG
jgi:hypothetical protein